MTSAKKAQSNRQNALKSTGPKTPSGKAAVRLNAVRHGLLSREVLLPGEDEVAFRELDKRLREELQPVGELENMLVDRLIGTYWRLRRIGRVEGSIFAREHYRDLTNSTRKEILNYSKQLQEEKGKEISGSSKPRIEDNEKLKELLVRIRELEEMQDGETTALGRAFSKDANRTNAFSKLSRYETTLERSLYKALHELQRLQAARHAKGNVSPPLAVDVDVSGVSTGDL
jgi:hypothetical protein